MPRENHPPYFPFYPDDFASDSNVEAMRTEGVGAYILLLCKSWREVPVASLPNDDAILARWARVSPARWVKLKPAVMAAFTSGTDNRWHQKRLRLEYEKFRANQNKKAVAGRIGAESRWHSHATAMRPPMAEDSSSSSSSSSSSPPSGGGGGERKNGSGNSQVERILGMKKLCEDNQK